MDVLVNLLLSGLVVAIAAYLTPGAHVDSYLTAIIVAVVLALVNSTVGLALKIVTFPLNILTLGLISILINILMVLLVAKLVPGFSLNGFSTALIFALILAVINMAIGSRWL